MLRSTLKTLALLASLASVAACGGGDSGPDCTDMAAQTRGQQIISDMTNGCQSCHASAVTGADRGGAPPTVTFDNAANITANEERIRIRALEQKTMPPPAAGGPLNNAQINDLEAFLSCRDNS